VPSVKFTLPGVEGYVKGTIATVPARAVARVPANAMVPVESSTKPLARILPVMVGTDVKRMDWELVSEVPLWKTRTAPAPIVRLENASVPAVAPLLVKSTMSVPKLAVSVHNVSFESEVPLAM